MAVLLNSYNLSFRNSGGISIPLSRICILSPLSRDKKSLLEVTQHRGFGYDPVWRMRTVVLQIKILAMDFSKAFFHFLVSSMAFQVSGCYLRVFAFLTSFYWLVFVPMCM